MFIVINVVSFYSNILHVNDMFFFILGSPDKAEPVASRTKVDLVLPEVCTGKNGDFPGQN